MWTIESGMWSSGTFYDFMRGLFGWHRSPENIRVIAYFVYLLPVLAIYLRDAKPKSSNAVVQNRTESAQVA
jgi:high-affinity Fe2+/Pb2+ permease